MSTTDTIDETTAVPTRKRALDQLTFRSSHADCYALGRHAKTPQGREMCRTGQGFSGIQAKPEPTNMKSPTSNVVHAPGDAGQSTVCGSSGWMLMKHVPVADYLVTCKNCIKRSA